MKIFILLALVLVVMSKVIAVGGVAPNFLMNLNTLAPLGKFKPVIGCERDIVPFITFRSISLFFVWVKFMLPHADTLIDETVTMQA